MRSSSALRGTRAWASPVPREPHRTSLRLNGHMGASAEGEMCGVMSACAPLSRVHAPVCQDRSASCVHACT